MWEIQREGSRRGDNVQKMLAIMNMCSTELSYENTNVFISFHNT